MGGTRDCLVAHRMLLEALEAASGQDEAPASRPGGAAVGGDERHRLPAPAPERKVAARPGPVIAPARTMAAAGRRRG